jgi:hypothetical protein
MRVRSPELVLQHTAGPLHNNNMDHVGLQQSKTTITIRFRRAEGGSFGADVFQTEKFKNPFTFLREFFPSFSFDNDGKCDGVIYYRQIVFFRISTLVSLYYILVFHPWC